MTRRRRVCLYDDEEAVLEVLKIFFEARGYEIIACAEPVSCPVYLNPAAACGNLAPCSDLLLTDYDMPRMTGLEMLRLQAGRGCRLTMRNKAVISGRIDAAALVELRALGCSFLAKPFRLAQLSAWVDECERRMDLSQPLGLPRKEDRTPCCTLISLGARAGAERAEVVDVSRSGLCIRSGSAPAVHQLVALPDELPVASKTAVVRWVRPAEGGSYFVGLSCC